MAGARGRSHAPPPLTQQLDRHRADAAAAAVDERERARRGRRHVAHRRPDGQHRLGQRRGILERNAIGSRQHLHRGHRDLLGVSAPGEQRAHARADRPAVDALADGADRARALQPDDLRRARRRRVLARGLHQVGTVHGGRDDVDDHLAAPGHRIGRIRPLERLVDRALLHRLHGDSRSYERQPRRAWAPGNLSTIASAGGSGTDLSPRSSGGDASVPAARRGARGGAEARRGESARRKARGARATASPP